MLKAIGTGLADGIVALFSLTAFSAPVTPDYAREKKWADEVVPGLVIGDPVYLQTPRGHHKFLTLFTPVAGTDKAVIVDHGMGIHPDWGMVGTMRTELADRGFATLSIQMPILAADAQSEAYPPTFPEAAERIAEAVAFLKAKGYAQLAIVSHSMGSRMSRVYVAGKPDAAVKAWASLGLSVDDYAGTRLRVHGSLRKQRFAGCARQRADAQGRPENSGLKAAGDSPCRPLLQRT